MAENIVIIGGSGALGSAFTCNLRANHPDAQIVSVSRHGPSAPLEGVLYRQIVYNEEDSIVDLAVSLSKDKPIDMAIVTTGILHDNRLDPEKSLRDLSADKLGRIFEINTVYPALIAKHFLPKLCKEKRAIFAILSAKVGSISDNNLGGWYAYRASKAALNMIIKTAAIEIKRSNKQAIIVGLHPGTVDSALSKPFQRNIPEGKLFTPDFASKKLLGVLNRLNPDHSGKCFAWDGKEILP